jgi:hypothetical protein
VCGPSFVQFFHREFGSLVAFLQKIGRRPGRSSQAVLSLDACPWPAPRQARRRDQILASTSLLLRQAGRLLVTPTPQTARGSGAGLRPSRTDG